METAKSKSALTGPTAIATISPLFSVLEHQSAIMAATLSPMSLQRAHSLRARMKVLHITTPQRSGSWLAEALAADNATEIVLSEAQGAAAGLARLRDEIFDAVLVSHEPGVLDALDLVEVIRTGGNEEPILLFGALPAQEIDALCCEVGADDYCCVAETSVRGLLWKFSRAVERSQLRRENRKLLQAERQRLKQEHSEAERLLQQQRALIADLEDIGLGATRKDSPNGHDPKGQNFEESLAQTATAGLQPWDELPTSLLHHYRELLRTYVIMGAGNLSDEMSGLAEHLVSCNVSAQHALQLHVAVLEELVQGLGNRSARHVMNRADLLVLEVMGHLTDGYRRRYRELSIPQRQLSLPGFDAAA